MIYNRQLPLLGKNKLKQLKNSRVAVIGLGALGSISSQLLARSGIGTLIIIDRDIVEESNLSSQLLYKSKDLSNAKSVAAENALKTIAPQTNIIQYSEDLTYENINILLKNVDLIIDGTDNMFTRFLINDYCKKNKIPWIYGAAVGFTGRVMPFVNGKDKPCFRCIFDEKHGTATCETSGILISTAAIVASLQVKEAINILTKTPVSSEIHHLNLENISSLISRKAISSPNCKPCKGLYEFLSGNKKQSIIKSCGSDRFIIHLSRIVDLRKMKSNLNKISPVKDFGTLLRWKNTSVFKNRVLIEAKTEAQAKSIFTKYFGDI